MSTAWQRLLSDFQLPLPCAVRTHSSPPNFLISSLHQVICIFQLQDPSLDGHSVTLREEKRLYFFSGWAALHRGLVPRATVSNGVSRGGTFGPGLRRLLLLCVPDSAPVVFLCMLPCESRLNPWHKLLKGIFLQLFTRKEEVAVHSSLTLAHTYTGNTPSAYPVNYALFRPKFN